MSHAIATNGNGTIEQAVDQHVERCKAILNTLESSERDTILQALEQAFAARLDKEPAQADEGWRRWGDLQLTHCITDLAGDLILKRVEAAQALMAHIDCNEQTLSGDDVFAVCTALEPISEHLGDICRYTRELHDRLLERKYPKKATTK